MIEELMTWAETHAEWLSVVGLGSLVMLLATPLAVPLWVASLPADYFVRGSRRPNGWVARLRTLLATLLGAVLVAVGVLMLFLPGQGLLTLFVGLSLMRFPGKHALQRRLLSRPGVARALQWMRRRGGRPPLELPGAAPRDTP